MIQAILLASELVKTNTELLMWYIDWLIEQGLTSHQTHCRSALKLPVKDKASYVQVCKIIGYNAQVYKVLAQD